MNTERRRADPGGMSTKAHQRRADTTDPASGGLYAPAEPPGGSTRVEAQLRAGSVAGLRSMRTGLGYCLEQGACRPETIADAQLVLAEIATNAFVHDLAPLVDVRVVCTDEDVTIATAHRGDIVPPAYPVRPAPTAGPFLTAGGRGLAIVDRIVSSREVANADGRTTTTVRLPR